MKVPVSMYAQVEIRSTGHWEACVDAAVIIDGHYDLFALLFGVTNEARFRPLFAGRGLPQDVSEAVTSVAQEYPEEWFGHSWASWGELRSLDPTVRAEGMDERVHIYRQGERGEMCFVTKRLLLPHEEEVRLELDRRGEARREGLLYRRVRLTGADALAGTRFRTLVDVMTALVATFGEEGVRLVAMFAH